MLLLLCTAQRRSDVVKMGREHDRGQLAHHGAVRQQQLGAQLARLWQGFRAHQKPPAFVQAAHFSSAVAWIMQCGLSARSRSMLSSRCRMSCVNRLTASTVAGRAGSSGLRLSAAQLAATCEIRMARSAKVCHVIGVRATSRARSVVLFMAVSSLTNPIPSALVTALCL